MWEVVARMHVSALADDTPAASWITPASEGRRIHRSQLAARLEARRLTRKFARDRLARIARADAHEAMLAASGAPPGAGLAEKYMARHPATTWEARPYGPKHRRAPFSR